MSIGKHHPHVLMIDDQLMVVEMVEAMLEDQSDITFNYVTDATNAMTTAHLLKPTVVLADLKMPLIDGFGIIGQFRSDPHLQQIPIILLSSEEMPELKVRAFAEGANDYLIKWPHKLELLARIRHHSDAYIAHRQRDEAFRSLHRSQQELLERTRELEESQAALHRAQKLEAIGKLTGGVAHDFNNVLQIISGNLQLLRIEADGHAGMQERIAAALQGVDRGAGLASQLLAFARRQPLQPVIMNVGHLMRDAEQLLRRAIDDRIALETAVAPDLWNALIDPNQLENVLFNLVLNARDAMRESGGELKIEARNAVLDGSEHLDGDRVVKGDHIELLVTDNGPGMTPEVLERAFEPFFTTKPEGEGTGLGLSMAYGFIKQSGGHIRIDSALGQGTTVRIFLPRSLEKASAPRKTASREIAAGSGTILVVEDEAEIRVTTVEILSRLGYRTLQAEDAQSGLELIESDGSVDLLFTDVVMPGPMRSMEMVEKARKLRPNLRVLFASGYTKGSMLENGRLDPGVSLLQKPYSHDDLAGKIRRMLQEAGPQGQAGD